MKMKFHLVTALVTVLFSAASVLGTNYKCGSTISLRSFSFSSPADVPQECSYKIKAVTSRICQMKLEFNNFSLAPPTFQPYSRCLSDKMKADDLELCGENAGQHVYIHLTSTKREIDLVFTTANRGLNPFLPKPTWNIKVSQIECTDSTAAPTSCLQYFTAKSGVIESFNFNNGLGPYPGNMQYAICLHKPQPVVRMRFTVTYFNIGYGAALNRGFDEDCLSTVPSTGRSEDYLFIPGSQVVIGTVPLRVDKFCGTSLMATTVTSTIPGPIVMYFNADSLYEGKQKPEIGFRMYYEII